MASAVRDGDEHGNELQERGNVCLIYDGVD